MDDLHPDWDPEAQVQRRIDREQESALLRDRVDYLEARKRMPPATRRRDDGEEEA